MPLEERRITSLVQLRTLKVTSTTGLAQWHECHGCNHLSDWIEGSLCELKPMPGAIIGQEPVVGQVIGSKREPTTITLLNGHTLKPKQTANG